MGENRLERKRRGDQRKEEVKSVKRVEKKKTRQKVGKGAKIARRNAKQKKKRHN